MSAWQAAEDRRDLAFKEGRYNEAYGKPAHTDAEIRANFDATFKAQSEWDVGDTICIADERYRKGTITDFGGGGTVRVLMPDRTNYYLSITPGMTVRREQ